MNIKTHHAPHCEPPWIAIDMDKAAAKLKNSELMASYCRLVEEAGLCHYGETEDDAIAEASE